MRRSAPLVVGNWKCHPPRASAAKELFSKIKRALPREHSARVLIAPPTVYLPELARRADQARLGLGAQDVFYADAGAYTGQHAPGMLAQYGVTHTIIGHSERRALGETDEQVARKLRAAHKHKLTPIICLGESKRDGQGEFFNFVERQLRAALTGLSAAQLARTVIAYEPIWAIGTGQTATAEDVKEMQLFIVSTLTKLFDRTTAAKTTLLYGGSVKSTNAAELHAEGGMRGFLVGGASLRPDDFAGIVRAVDE